MRKFLGLLIGLLMIFGIAGNASAVVLTFEDFSPSAGGSIADGYNGLNWFNFGYKDVTTIGWTQAAAVSGDYVASNSSGTSASVSSATPFTFDGAWLTSAWGRSFSTLVKGYASSSEIYSQTVAVTSTPTRFDFDFIGVDTVGFYSSDTEIFAMDDFTYSGSAPIPEPSTILLFGLGLLGIGGAYLRRRRKN